VMGGLFAGIIVGDQVAGGHVHAPVMPPAGPQTKAAGASSV